MYVNILDFENLYKQSRSPPSQGQYAQSPLGVCLLLLRYACDHALIVLDLPCSLIAKKRVLFGRPEVLYLNEQRSHVSASGRGFG